MLSILLLCLAPDPPASASPVSRKAAARRPTAIAVRSPPPPLAPGDLISLDLKDADIRDVVRTFARLTRRNVVIDPGVKGSVTVRLVDVRWEDALDVILRSNGLAAVEEGRMLRVAPPQKLVEENEEN